MGIGIKFRKTSANTCVIEVLNNQNIDNVLSHIADEMFLMVTEGLDVVDPLGQKARIFFDIMANLSTNHEDSAWG